MNNIIIWVLFTGIALFSTYCTIKSTNPNTFSKAMDIVIPENVEVIKDEFRDMWQDYAIEYEIKLTEKQLPVLTKSIRKSIFYNENKFSTTAVTPDMWIKSNDMEAVWVKYDSGYIFQNHDEHYMYSAEIDTVTLTAKFMKAYD